MEKLIRRKVKCISDAVDVVEADVTLTALDTTHVRTIEAGTVGKFFLAQVGFVS